MRGWGSTTDRIMLLLKDNELTKIEICTKLGLTHDDVASVLTRLRRDSIKFGKRIYICGWQREAVGKRYYLRAVFKAGSKIDQPKPPALTPRERSQRSHRKKMLIKRSVIFKGDRHAETLL